MPDVARFLGRLARTATSRPLWQRFGAAFALALCAAVITPILTDANRAPFFTLFTFAVVLSSLFGGMKPGFAACGLSAAGIAYIAAPASSFRVASSDDLVRIGLFVAVGCTISAFIGTAGELQYRLDVQRERLAVTLRSIGDAVIATDAEGRVTFMNAVAEQATGWTIAEAQGKLLEAVFNIVNEATRSTVENPVRKVIASGRIVGLANHTVLLRKDGTEIPIDDSAAPIVSSGRIEGVVLVFRDITEAKQSQAALMRSEKLASVGRLASTIAHEINNPLEAVSNLLYLLEQDPTMNAVSKERVEVAQAELARAAEVSRQTLSFHKLQQKRQRVNVKEAVESVLRLYDSRAENRRVEFATQIAPTVYVHAVPTQFRQILSNFVTNALDAMPSGGVLTIAASAVQNDGRPTVELCFTDNGTGIDKADLKKIFEPFYTTKADVGTGLGLWLTKSIIGEHDGEVQVESDTTPGNSGTTFRVRLPGAVEAKQAAGEAVAD
jgi:PAS domain S-box-containing protein